MYDYREDRFYKMYLVLFIVTNFSKNKKERKILTLRKIELLYFIIKNPIKLKSCLINLELGEINNYKPLLYDNSVFADDFDFLDNIRETIVYLISVGKINYQIIDGTKYFYSKSQELVEAPNDIIGSNFKMILKLVSQSESKLTKAIVGI